ncbi:MAG: histidinol dehydrogenase [Hyphomicrobiaceae bacterium]|nr:histidinol dehydrogenase [Hyphomicrobiaceae bacterium]
MPLRLDARQSDFEARFVELLSMKREVSLDVEQTVRTILDDVRVRGDEALVELSQKFDHLDLNELGIKVSAAQIEQAVKQTDEKIIEALEFAAKRIKDHHKRHKPLSERYTDDLGVELGQRWTAVDAAGLYVPGGTAAYPSSVLMNAIPAKVAGVERLAMVVPMPHGKISPQVLAAAKIAGVDEIYRVGGAQAVAALAYGTDTIAPVSVIVGPGNAYVAAAKRQVYGTVGIDMIAGPSEVLIVADGDNNPDWIAIDLLAQAEHDKSAQSILITDDKDFADRVVEALEKHLKTLSRADIARASWDEFGAIILVENLEDCIPLCNRLAAEHLEIATGDPDALAEQITNAGAIFLGAYTPEVIGDYVAGTNHVLPTARSARFSSALGVTDFMKRTSLIRCTASSLRALAPAAVTLGEAEGLTAHARSASIRLNLPE